MVSCRHAVRVNDKACPARFDAQHSLCTARLQEWLTRLGAPSESLDMVAAANPVNLGRLRESGHLQLLEASGVQVGRLRECIGHAAR
jgi:hypothetical protein